MNLNQEVAALERLTVRELRAKYAEVFGEGTRAFHKVYLIKRIGWRLQALAEGDLSERARQRAAELANQADLRTTPPPSPGTAQRQRSVRRRVPSKPPRPADPALPTGAVLTRFYKGRTIQVRVLAEGFECEGQVHRSLSAVAQAITGAHWNGRLFFGVAKEVRA
jgi:hypothetical protein